MGLFKKFTLNLTTVVLPNLIAHDLVLVQPMASASGYIAYIKYTAGSNKGATTRGDVLNDPFKLGSVDPSYTSSAVVEEFTGDGTAVKFALAWTPVVALGKVFVDGAEVAGSTVNEAGEVTLAAAPANDKKVIAYTYDNVVIPQNELPTIKAELAHLSLVAKARRVAIYYSQIAAFQAKTDHGIDLGDQLAEKAVGQLAYEIDTEITDKLISIAGAANALLKWSKVVPLGISKKEHYEGFSEIIEVGKTNHL